MTEQTELQSNYELHSSSIAVYIASLFRVSQSLFNDSHSLLTPGRHSISKLVASIEVHHRSLFNSTGACLPTTTQLQGPVAV